MYETKLLFCYYLGSDCNSFIIAKSKKVSEISSHLLFRLFTYFSLFLSLKSTVRYRLFLALNGLFPHSMYHFIQGHCRENIKTQFCLSKERKPFTTVPSSRVENPDLFLLGRAKVAPYFLSHPKSRSISLCVAQSRAALSRVAQSRGFSRLRRDGSNISRLHRPG